MDHLEYFGPLLIFIITIQMKTCHLLTFLYMRLNRTLAILLTLYNTNKFKQSHDLVVGICRCINELITLIIHLAQKSKHIIKMFAIHPFPFLSQCMRGHFCEVWAYAMRDVGNCDTVCDILHGDKADYHSKAWIWNGSDPNHKVTIHESGALTFVFVIRRRCCWIATHCLLKPECRVGVRVRWHMKT